MQKNHAVSYNIRVYLYEYRFVDPTEIFVRGPHTLSTQGEDSDFYGEGQVPLHCWSVTKRRRVHLKTEGAAWMSLCNFQI